MRKSRNTLFGILALALACETVTAVPTEGAELYVPNAHQAVPGRLFSYPYGGTYQRVDYAKRIFGYPYVGSYYGNYYSRDYAYSYVPPYGSYYEPLYPSYYGYSSTCHRSRRCSRPL